MAKGGLRGLMRRASGGWIGGAASEPTPAAPAAAYASAWELPGLDIESYERVHAMLYEKSGTDDPPVKRKASASSSGSHKRQHTLK